MMRLLWIPLFLVGCTFHSNQIDMIRSILDREPVENFQWRATQASNSWILTAISQENLLIFLNDDGDALAFDGWVIRSLIGFGLSSSLLTISKDEGLRTFKRESLVSQHRCGLWSKKKFSDSTIRYIQPCDGVMPYKNFIDLDSKGSISRIDQVVTEQGDRIQLEKL